MTQRPDKDRRMTLRRQSGAHPWPKAAFWPEPAEPRRHAPYLVAHACFGCRRSVKVDVGHWPPRAAKCPECAGQLHWLGRTFRAPKRSDVKQWKKVEILWQAGYRFHSAWGGALPDTLKEAEMFIVAGRAAELVKRW